MIGSSILTCFRSINIKIITEAYNQLTVSKKTFEKFYFVADEF